MQEPNVILVKSFEFSLKIIEIYKFLIESKKEFVLSKQLLRSGTSIGANIEEAQEAESKADFIHKLSISNKECRETIYWLRLLNESEYLDDLENSTEIMNRVDELKKLLTAIIRSSKMAVK